ncbi:MAG TPA: hypothetical protein VLE99_02395 [Candidatus Saccharimonadales bacterium]|nr:hypothetical protein [Candidatus Saccharimonadales bacterium]
MSEAEQLLTTVPGLAVDGENKVASTPQFANREAAADWQRWADARAADVVQLGKLGANNA